MLVERERWKFNRKLKEVEGHITRTAGGGVPGRVAHPARIERGSANKVLEILSA